MRYEGNIFRPPSEAYSLIVQVTIGCAHNDCTFCSMFKDKQFRVRAVSEVLEDLEDARESYANVGRIFLADGDSLVLNNDKLKVILNKINELFPECERVSMYGAPLDVLNKTHEELVELKDLGVGIIYIGAESGSDKVLEDVKKGATRAQIIEAIQMIEAAGIQASVTFINGLAGPDYEDHALETASMINESKPSFVGLLTLMIEPMAPLYDEVRSGRFQLLEPLGVVEETLLMLEHIDLPEDSKTVFRSNHASNYISLRGDLPKDQQRMIAQLRSVLGREDMLKDERLRAL